MDDPPPRRARALLRMRRLGEGRWAGTGVGFCAALPGVLLADLLGWGWSLLVAGALSGLGAAVAMRLGDRRWQALVDEVGTVRRSAAARADLVAAVSHDVRTPLAMVKIAADLLRDGGPGQVNDRQHRFLTTITEQADQAIAIAEDLLVHAKIEAGMFSARLTPTELNRVVIDAVRGLRPLAEQRRQQISTDLPPLSPVLTLDQRLITRAIVNLSTNALRFTSAGGRVVLRVLDNQDSAVICVTDNGAGMTPAEREMLFRPFVSGSALADGTGLGLVLTRQIALYHGGQLLVDTKPQGGTTVMMRLPHRRDTVAADPSAMAEAGGP